MLGRNKGTGGREARELLRLALVMDAGRGVALSWFRCVKVAGSAEAEAIAIDWRI